MENQIEIYKTKDSKIEGAVQFDKETVWLNQRQMAHLFDKDTDTIGLHLLNIFKEKELDRKSTTEFFSVVQKEGRREVKRRILFYNLDAIISVGYRVNSKRGTQFRQWAAQQLKDYLVKGYSINQKRLEQLKQTIQLISQGSGDNTLQLKEAKGLLEIINSYAKSFVLLNQFDSNKLPEGKLNEKISYEIEYDEAKYAIDELKKQLIKNKEATALFGNEKDEGFKSSLQSIVQTFGGKYVYPSIE